MPTTKLDTENVQSWLSNCVTGNSFFASECNFNPYERSLRVTMPWYFEWVFGAARGPGKARAQFMAAVYNTYMQVLRVEVGGYAYDLPKLRLYTEVLHESLEAMSADDRELASGLRVISSMSLGAKARSHAPKLYQTVANHSLSAVRRKLGITAPTFDETQALACMIATALHRTTILPSYVDIEARLQQLEERFAQNTASTPKRTSEKPSLKKEPGYTGVYPGGILSNDQPVRTFVRSERLSARPLEPSDLTTQARDAILRSLSNDSPHESIED